jgi:phospholipid N-methyltransferase
MHFLKKFYGVQTIERLYKNLTPDLLYLYLDGMGTNLI